MGLFLYIITMTHFCSEIIKDVMKQSFLWSDDIVYVQIKEYQDIYVKQVDTLLAAKQTELLRS